MSTDKDLSSKSLEELLSMKNSLELEKEAATKTLRELEPFLSLDDDDDDDDDHIANLRGRVHHAEKRAEALTGANFESMFDNVHSTDPTVYCPPPKTLFTGWYNEYSIYREELLLFAAYQAGIELEKKINKIYMRKKMPLLDCWDEVIIHYANEAAKKPILSVEWLEEAEICWEEFHHWLSTCPADEHPMELSLEERKTGDLWTEERQHAYTSAIYGEFGAGGTIDRPRLEGAGAASSAVPPAAPPKIMETPEDNRSKYISSIIAIQRNLLNIRRKIKVKNIAIVRLKDANIYVKLTDLVSKARAEGYRVDSELEIEFILMCYRNAELRRIMKTATVGY
jgi:hypothetical protein